MICGESSNGGWPGEGKKKEGRKALSERRTGCKRIKYIGECIRRRREDRQGDIGRSEAERTSAKRNNKEG